MDYSLLLGIHVVDETAKVNVGHVTCTMSRYLNGLYMYMYCSYVYMYVLAGNINFTRSKFLLNEGRAGQARLLHPQKQLSLPNKICYCTN